MRSQFDFNRSCSSWALTNLYSFNSLPLQLPSADGRGTSCPGVNSKINFIPGLSISVYPWKQENEVKCLKSGFQPLVCAWESGPDINCFLSQQDWNWKDTRMSFSNPLYNYSLDVNGADRKSSEA